MVSQANDRQAHCQSAFDHVSLVEPINGRYNTIIHSSPCGVANLFFVWFRQNLPIPLPCKIDNQTPTFDRLVAFGETIATWPHLEKTTFLRTRHSLMVHRTVMERLLGP